MAEQPAEHDHHPLQPPGRLIGIAHEYADLLELIRIRVRELGITHEEMDRITGLPAQYSGKLLADPPLRKLGVVSLGCVLSALGLAIVIAEDAEQTVKIRPRLVLRRQSLPHAKPASGHWHSSAI